MTCLANARKAAPSFMTLERSTPRDSLSATKAQNAVQGQLIHVSRGSHCWIKASRSLRSLR
eukprot:9048400-Pyramimonas_sp.AAC.1